MENFRLQSDSLNRLVYIRYVDIVDYPTLMKSLRELFALSFPERMRIMLDFSEVKSFQVGYAQISSFRLGLRSIASSDSPVRIAVIKDPKSTWSGIFCSATPLIETELQLPDIRCFECNQQAEAWKWM